jgi:hypothetical protein
MLHLIKMWLEVPVEETDEKGNKHRTEQRADWGSLRSSLSFVPIARASRVSQGCVNSGHTMVITLRRAGGNTVVEITLIDCDFLDEPTSASSEMT